MVARDGYAGRAAWKGLAGNGQGDIGEIRLVRRNCQIGIRDGPTDEPLQGEEHYAAGQRYPGIRDASS